MSKLKIAEKYVPLYDYQASDVLTVLNLINSSDVKNDQIKISKPIVASATWVEENGNGDTIVYINAIPGKGLSGGLRTTYDRVDIDMMMAQTGNFLSIPKDVTTVHDTLPWILKRYGIKLYEDDVEDGKITWEVFQGPTPEAVEGQPTPVAPAPINKASFILKAIAASFVYTGTSTMDVTESPKILKDIVANEAIHSFKQKVINTSDVMVLDTMTYGVDASYDYEKLRKITPENYKPSEFMELLKGGIGGWTDSTLVSKFVLPPVPEAPKEGEEAAEVVPFVTPKDKLNLDDLKVSYNGLNSGIDVARKKFKYIMILSPKDETKTLVGDLYIHYNDINDLAEVTE